MPDTQSIRVLLADDVKINTIVAEKMLKTLGFSVTTVENGKEAIAELQRREYDVILMDVEMPEMDGYEATQRIRNGEAGVERKSVTVIAMTAHEHGEVRRRCKDVGMNGYIVKPIDFANLKKTIAECAERKPGSGC